MIDNFLLIAVDARRNARLVNWQGGRFFTNLNVDHQGGPLPLFGISIFPFNRANFTSTHTVNRRRRHRNRKYQRLIFRTSRVNGRVARLQQAGHPKLNLSSNFSGIERKRINRQISTSRFRFTNLLRNTRRRARRLTRMNR